MGKRWRIFPHDADRVTRLEKAAGVSPVVAQLMICRGIYEPAAVRTFLEPKMTALRDPGELPGVEQAVERIFAAITDQRRIVIYGDYDADGMTATAILYRCLSLLGANVGYYVPNRLEDGYGLNNEALRTLAHRGAELIVTVDCGIASVEHAETARELGLELIITDHHEFADRLPHAAAIVHPRLPGTAYPFGGLCGAGVAFKLAWALCQRSCEDAKVTPRLRSYLLSALGIAAIGTVADVVPLVDENRILVRHGLKSLREFPVPGLVELMRITKLDQKPQLSSEDIGFTIGPRLNAAGRLGQAQLGVELLTTDSSERAAALAEYIHELNNSRDSLERSIYLAAQKQIKEQFDPDGDAALVLADQGWHPGVIGIVAGRLAEKYHRPVVMIALDELGGKPGTGSARTACGVNLHEALAACTEHLVTHGGHAAAAGLRIDRAHVEVFRHEFCEHVSRMTTVEARVAEVSIDAESLLGQLTHQVVLQIEQLSPFGQGNPRPVLCASGITCGDVRRMGSGERHLSLRLTQHGVSMRGVGFGCGDWCEELAQFDGPIDVAFRPVINDFRGRRSVEVQLVDWRPAKSLAGTLGSPTPVHV